MRRPRPTAARRLARTALPTLAALAVVTLPATAGAAEVPTQPTGDVRLSVTTPSGWTVEDRGPKDPQDQITTQLVVRSPGGAVDTLLYPERDVPDYCDERGEGFHCMPLRVLLEKPPAFGKNGLLVTDQNGDGVPEIAISMFSGGAHCCITTVGWWREASGAWKSDLTNGGSAGGDVTDAQGRVRIANPGFESMSWSYAASLPFYSWSRLVPGRGWVDATTRGEHRARIRAMDKAIKRYSRVRDADEVVQSARAVRIGHRHALGETRRELAERRTYRRAYGRADARALTTVLKSVRRVR